MGGLADLGVGAEEVADIRIVLAPYLAPVAHLIGTPSGASEQNAPLFTVHSGENPSTEPVAVECD